MEAVVTTGPIRRAKLQSNRHHQQTNTQIFTGRMPFLSPNQQCWSTEGKDSYRNKCHIITLLHTAAATNNFTAVYKVPSHLAHSTCLIFFDAVIRKQFSSINMTM